MVEKVYKIRLKESSKTRQDKEREACYPQFSRWCRGKMENYPTEKGAKSALKTSYIVSHGKQSSDYEIVEFDLIPTGVVISG